MSTSIRRFFILFLFASGLAAAQPSLIFKTRRIDTSSSAPVRDLASRLVGPQHLVIQFDHTPSQADIAELKSRGVNVLGGVPYNGLIVSLASRVAVGDLGIRYAAPIDPADKISPVASTTGFVLVEFHPDVGINLARSLILAAGIELRENPDLSPRHLMIPDDPSAIRKLADLDEVAYVFPASTALVNRVPTRAYEGALTTTGSAAGSIPTYGAWGGQDLHAVTLTYVFSQMTQQLSSASVQSEIERAMAEWSKAVEVTWKQGSNPTGNQTVNILFATYAHGDGFPFDGPNGILAHTFYPAPPNPEPIAGDMHFNDSETWKIGADTDVFSVALHELGHSLGLGHADSPSAVMYPYYKMSTELSPLDISTVQTLYAAAQPGSSSGSGSSGSGSSSNGSSGSSGTPNPLPPSNTLTLTVNPPPSTTTSAAINLTGATTGGKGIVLITWSTNQNVSGSVESSGAWTIAGLPLAAGSNTITVKASDSSTSVSRVVAVTRQSSSGTAPPANPPSGNTPTGNAPTGTTPPALTILSPSSTSVETSASSITFSGTSSDAAGVASVTWATNTGQSGTASGTTSWSATIPLLVGLNAVTINATDTAGNVSWRSVIVTRN